MTSLGKRRWGAAGAGTSLFGEDPSTAGCCDGSGGGGGHPNSIDFTGTQPVTLNTVPIFSLTTGYGADESTLEVDGDDVKAVGRVLAGPGTEALPTFGFRSDPDTGIYLPSSEELGFVTAGTEQVSLTGARLESAVPIRAPLGTVNSGAFVHSASIGTGMYFPSTTSVALSAVTTEALRCTTSEVEAKLPIWAPDGSLAQPSYVFQGNTDTGMYLASPNFIGFGANGSQILTMDASNGVSMYNGGILNTNGTEAAPTYAFFNDADTGLFLAASNTIGFSAAGSEVAAIDPNWFEITGGMGIRNRDGTAAVPSYSFSTDQDTGLFLPHAGGVGVSCEGVEVMQVSAAALKVRLGEAATGYSLPMVYNSPSTTKNVALLADQGTNDFAVTKLHRVKHNNLTINTVTNTVAETTLFSSIVPAYELSNARVLTMKATGLASWAAGPPSLTFRTKLGGEVLTFGPTLDAAGGVNCFWELSVQLSVAVVGGGSVDFFWTSRLLMQNPDTGTLTLAHDYETVASVSESAANTALVSVQWGAASASNSITLTTSNMVW